MTVTTTTTMMTMTKTKRWREEGRKNECVRRNARKEEKDDDEDYRSEVRVACDDGNVDGSDGDGGDGGGLDR